MPRLLLEIPEEVMDALRLPPSGMDRELRIELALALYQRGALSGGKARKLAGLSCWHFGQRTLKGRSGTFSSGSWKRIEHSGHCACTFPTSR